jgi:hypothetical protein
MHDQGQSRLPRDLSQDEFNALVIAAHRARSREMARVVRIGALKLKALAERLTAFHGGGVEHA